MSYSSIGQLQGLPSMDQLIHDHHYHHHHHHSTGQQQQQQGQQSSSTSEWFNHQQQQQQQQCHGHAKHQHIDDTGMPMSMDHQVDTQCVDRWVPPPHLMNIAGGHRSGSPTRGDSNHQRSLSGGVPSPLLSPTSSPPEQYHVGSHDGTYSSSINSSSSSPGYSLHNSPLTTSPRVRSHLVDLDSEDDNTRGRALSELNDMAKRRERRRSHHNIGPLLDASGAMLSLHHERHPSDDMMHHTHGGLPVFTNNRPPLPPAPLSTQSTLPSLMTSSSSMLPPSQSSAPTGSLSPGRYQTNNTSDTTLAIDSSSIAAMMSQSNASTSPYAFPPHTIPSSYSAFSTSPPQTSRTTRIATNVNDSNNNNIPNSNTGNNSNAAFGTPSFPLSTSPSNALSTSSSSTSFSAVAPLTPAVGNSNSNSNNNIVSGSASSSSSGNQVHPPTPSGLTINQTLPYDIDNNHYSPTLSHIGVAAVSASPLIALSRLRTNSGAGASTTGGVGGTNMSINTNSTTTAPSGVSSPAPKSKKDKSQDPDNPTPIFHLPTALLNEGGMASGRTRRASGSSKDNGKDSKDSNTKVGSSSSSASNSPNQSPHGSPVMTSSTGSLHSLRARSISSFTLPPASATTSAGSISLLATTSTSTSGSKTPPRSDSPPPPSIILDAMTMLRLADENAFARPRRSVRHGGQHHAGRASRGLPTIVEKRSLTAPMPIRRLASTTTIDHHYHRHGSESSEAESTSLPSSPEQSMASLSLGTSPHGGITPGNTMGQNPNRRTFAAALAATNNTRRQAMNQQQQHQYGYANQRRGSPPSSSSSSLGASPAPSMGQGGNAALVGDYSQQQASPRRGNNPNNNNRRTSPPSRSNIPLSSSFSNILTSSPGGYGGGSSYLGHSSYSGSGPSSMNARRY